ncbi:MAG: serine hydrolase [Nocardioides sp.]
MSIDVRVRRLTRAARIRWHAAPVTKVPVTIGLVTIGLVATVLAGPTASAEPDADPRTGRSVDRTAARSYAAESARLSRGLAKALRSSGLDDLVDFDNRVDGSAQPAEFLPNVDLAVIELSRRGRVLGAANVLYDRDSPRGYRVKVKRSKLRARGVQFARWNEDRFHDSAAWAAGPSDAELLTRPRRVRKQFMNTYPASVLKIMVAHGILRLVDQGKLRLRDRVVFADRGGKSCAAAPSNPDGIDPPPVADGASDTVDGWLDQMITVSDNFATCVLLQELYDQRALRATNRHFRRLGLHTLRMRPRDPEVGSGWSSGKMSMGALDTAKLMLIASGAPGRLWTAPSGRRVTAQVLSRKSRRYYRGLLAQQSFNEVLNPVNLCGSSDAAPGIPSTVSKRWIDKETGHVVTYDGDLVIDFGYDVRPCTKKAEVRFLHKTGLVTFAGADTGIVRALPGKGGRRYVVAVQSSIGYRYGEADWATADPNACEDAPFVCYPRGFGRLGQAVDQLVKRR